MQREPASYQLPAATNWLAAACRRMISANVHAASFRLLSCALVIAACAPTAPAADIDAQMTAAVQTAVAAIVQTQIASTPAATETPMATPTVPRTPPALPADLHQRDPESAGYATDLHPG